MTIVFAGKLTSYLLLGWILTPSNLCEIASIKRIFLYFPLYYYGSELRPEFSCKPEIKTPTFPVSQPCSVKDSIS